MTGNLNSWLELTQPELICQFAMSNKKNLGHDASNS